jgi:uncharacterized protein involved in oxidation of intracellular sulfur
MAEQVCRKTLIILNDPPYGTERSYNGMRLASALSKDEDDEVRVFLIGDAVVCAKRGQQTPNGFYNLERMLKVASRQGVSIGT